MPNRKQRRSYKKFRKQVPLPDQRGFAPSRMQEYDRELVEARHLEDGIAREQERRSIQVQWPMLEMMAYIPESVQQRTAEYYARKETESSE